MRFGSAGCPRLGSVFDAALGVFAHAVNSGLNHGEDVCAKLHHGGQGTLHVLGRVGAIAQARLSRKRPAVAS